MCSRVFERSAGLSSHMFQAHPNQWNELKRRRDASYRSNARTYVRWTPDDLRRMAALEREALSLNVHNINTYIGSCLARSSDQVSCRRRRKDYKDLLKSLENSAPCPGSDGAQPQVVPGAQACDPTPAGTPPARPVAPVARTGRIWSGPEIKVLTSAPPGTTDADLAPLLPGRSITAIRSKRKRLPQVTTLVGDADPAPRVSQDEEPDTAGAQPPDDVQRDDSRAIVEYITGLLPKISDPLLRNKAEQALSEPDGFSTFYYEVFPKNRTANKRTKPPIKAGIRRHRHQRSAVYKFLQRLHSRSPKSVAERVLDSDLSYEGLVAERSFSDEDFLRKWKPVFERDCFADLADSHRGPSMNELLSPILVSDIASALASMKESSPGPDGLRLNTLRDIPVEVITLLCNLLLLKGPPPSRGRAGNIFTSRVTFIKKVEIPGDPLDFRPIAIGNYFVRVFHRVLACRFEASLPNHRDQAGFQRHDGIAHNVLKLHAAIAEARNKNENLVVASVDIRKAFDSLSHKALLGILERKGVPDPLLHYFRSHFSSSRLQIGRDLIHPAHRGVKQGDPMSPWLFNIAMDQILEGQEEYAFSIGAFVLNQMAYADDLILFASSPEEMQRRIDRLLVGLGRLGLELNALKCRVLCIRGNKKRKFCYVDTSVSVLVDGVALPVVTAESEFKYLGVCFNWRGIARTPLGLDHLLTRLDRAALKPQQKLNFLRKFLLPRLHHRLVFGRHHRAELVRGDKMTRRAVRRWLRLPADCPNSAIHAPARFGGLGVASLEQLVSALKSNRLSLFTEGYAEDAPLSSIPSVRSLMTYRFHTYSNCTREGLVEDLHSRLDTRGLKGYDHVPAVNSWLDYAPATLAGVEFQDAIRVRLGCMGTPARFSRGGRVVDPVCKCGRNAPMSLPHVAQACGLVDGLRRKRHNNIVLFVAQTMRKRKLDVIMEPRFETERGLRKPDIMVRTGKGLIFLDVQVRPDSAACSLDTCNAEKIRKYNQRHFLDAVRDCYGSDIPIQVVALTYNWRGAVAQKSYQDCHTLGLLRWRHFGIISRMVLRDTARMLRAYWRAPAEGLTRPAASPRLLRDCSE